MDTTYPMLTNTINQTFDEEVNSSIETNSTSIVLNGMCLFNITGEGWSVGDGSNYANAQCGNISENLIIPQDYESFPIIRIEARAFHGIKLNSVVLPDSIVYIGESAFDKCYMTGNITLPSSLEILENFTFSSNNVEVYSIGPNLRILGNGTFGDNPTLERIIIDESNPYFCVKDDCLYDFNKTIIYCVPPLVKTFQVPITVKKLLQRSISLTYVSTVILPTSVIEIDPYAFFRTPKLQTLHILGNLEITNERSIFSNQANLHIYYHGQKPVSTPKFVYEKRNTKVFVCDQYPSELFSDIKVSKYGNCYQICHTAELRTRPFSYILAAIFILFSP